MRWQRLLSRRMIVIADTTLINYLILIGEVDVSGAPASAGVSCR
jgi:hypothetical protein